jgi:D-inositol-3-phosphate glycosyltransferase
MIHGRFTGVRLEIPGGSPHLALRGALAARGLSERADFRGFVNREAMAALYAAADVVLITSATESFCNPAIEAAAAGRWLVAPPLPVLRETGGPMARFASSADPVDLADSVLRVAGLPPDEGLREQARAHAKTFTAEVCAGSLRRLLESAFLTDGRR